MKKFTLLELLITISIIVILASMLLPALKNARQSAQKTACMNNLKQIGVSTLFYAGDFSGWTQGGLPNSPNSLGGLTNKLNLGRLYPDYLSQPSILWCPADKYFSMSNNWYYWPNGSTNPAMATSSYESFINMWAWGTHISLKLEGPYPEVQHDYIRATSASRQPLCSDRFGMSVTTSIPPTHTGYYNVLYIDGHVKGFSDPTQRLYTRAITGDWHDFMLQGWEDFIQGF